MQTTIGGAGRLVVPKKLLDRLALGEGGVVEQPRRLVAQGHRLRGAQGMTQYVMVPVPEELAEEVEHFLRWNVGRPAAPSWDEGLIARIMEGADEASRELLRFVARATLDGRELAVSEVALKLRRSSREVVGTVIELINLVLALGGPPFTLMLKEVLTPPSGPFWHTRVLVMAEEAATLVLAVPA